LQSLEHRISRVTRALAPESRPIRVRRLGGGALTTMHAFDLDTDRELLRLVLRRYRPGEQWRTVLSGLLRTLAVLESEGIAAPRVLWSDPEGSSFGVPAVVLTRFRGATIGRPSDPVSWARQLGATLARIHAIPISKYDFSYLPPSLEVAPAFLERAMAPTAAVSGHPLAGVVLDGLRHLREGLALERPTFTHGDFWPGQSIWWRGRLEGIVDWDFPRLDDPGIDIGYCRMDIAIIANSTVADEFLRAYEGAAARTVTNRRFWDLIAAYQAMEHPGRWHRQGFIGMSRPDLQGAELERKLARFVRGE
jgi:aminoglycoside phosphotransferase (APT) family kinase protein